MRQFFYFSKSHTVCDQLTWTHYRTILTIKNENERNYYINLVILNNLSVRELKSPMLIKNILRLLVILVILHYQLKIIKDLIILKTDKNMDKIDEQAIHKYIISLLEDKFLELGTGFTLAGHEYKLHIDNKTKNKICYSLMLNLMHM